MALVQSTVVKDPEVPKDKKFAVNVKTGVLFVSHIDMFHRPNDGSAWRIPQDMEFFPTEAAAKARQADVKYATRVAAGLDGDEPEAAPEPPPAGRDWTKITTKSKLNEHAKEVHGFELNTNCTFKNMQAQYIAGVSAKEAKFDPTLAIRGVALTEGDHVMNDSAA
jgi:hypothetical protein